LTKETKEPGHRTAFLPQDRFLRHVTFRRYLHNKETGGHLRQYRERCEGTKEERKDRREMMLESALEVLVEIRMFVTWEAMK
jgi:hypothetical protein